MKFTNALSICTSMLFCCALAQGCKKDEGKKSSAKKAAEATATPVYSQLLEGNWQADCKSTTTDGTTSGTIIKLSFEASRAYTSTVQVYEGITCVPAKLLSTVEVKGSYTLGNVVALLDAIEIDLTNVTNHLTFHRQEIVDASNQSNLCGSGWVINQPRTITAETCPTSDVQSQPVERQVIKIQPKELILGKKLTGTSSEQRPGTLDQDFIYKKI